MSAIGETEAAEERGYFAGVAGRGAACARLSQRTSQRFTTSKHIICSSTRSRQGTCFFSHFFSQPGGTAAAALEADAAEAAGAV